MDKEKCPCESCKKERYCKGLCDDLRLFLKKCFKRGRK